MFITGELSAFNVHEGGIAGLTFLSTVYYLRAPVNMLYFLLFPANFRESL